MHYQHHAYPHHDRPNAPRNAVTGGRQPFGRDGCGDRSHHTKVHDAKDKQRCRLPGTALDTAKPEPQAMSPRRRGTGRRRVMAARRASTTSQPAGLPCGKLQRAGCHHHHARGDRNDPCHRRQPGLRQRHRRACGKQHHTQHNPYREIARTHHRCKPVDRRLAGCAGSPSIGHQHRYQRWQHHRHHHRRPHGHERCGKTGPGLAAHG